VDNDLGITLGNGSGNIILQGSASGKERLVPLYLKIPSDVKQGATITLNANQVNGTAERVDVWTTSTFGPTSQPIIGNATGGLLWSKTWTVGTDTIPTTLWVGAFGGSEAMGDVAFHLSDSDATAVAPPVHPTNNSANSNVATAVRVAKIGNPCIPSYWPSPAGVACTTGGALQADVYDWTGKATAHVDSYASAFQSGVSPSGQSIFFSPGVSIGSPPPSTSISSPGPIVTVQAHAACLWIDDQTLLAPDAVIALTRNAQGYLVSPKVTALPASGQCAGRFPGGL